MKLTKYEHACFTLEKDGKVLVVDPGVWTSDFIIPENVVAIVVTHEHADHFDPETLKSIIDKNPGAVIIAHEDVTKQIPELPTKSVNAGDKITIEPFNLEFFGGNHAIIHPDYAVFANLGVLVDETLYYPGDSFAKPNKSVKVLALPVMAPWLKMSEAIDFLISMKPERAFPTHDAIASNIGKGLVDCLVGSFAEKHDIDYQRISGSIEI